MTGKIIYLVILFSVFLLGADSGSPDRDERGALRKQQVMLRERIEALRNERDYLLFRKTMYCSDSKYLIINIAKRTGQLKYKNRVLKDFRFKTLKNFPAGAFRQGTVALTKKVEGKNGQHALVFGKSFVVQWKRTAVPPEDANIPVVSLSRKNLISIFYAVEEGSMAFIER